MSDPLLSARNAATLQDWASVNELLQQALASSDLPATEILPLVLQVLEYGDFQERWDAVKLIPKLGDIAISPLLAILGDPEADVELRWFVGGVLADFHHPEAIASLIDIIHTSEEAELTEMAIATLGKIGTPAIEAISQLLTQPASRLLGVRTLAQIHLSQTIEPLLTAVKDAQIEVRSTALSALSSFEDPRITTVFREALADPSPEVRKAAVIGLGLRADPDLVPQLQPLLNDEDLEVCIASAIALGRMKTDAAAISLFERMQQPEIPLKLQLAIVRALSWIETPAALRYLEQLLELTSPSLCQSIIDRLGKVADPSLQAIASQILLSLLASKAPVADLPEIQQSIATACGELKQTEAIEPLIQLLAREDDRVRLHAIAALKQISPDLARHQLQQIADRTDIEPALAAGIAMAIQEW